MEVQGDCYLLIAGEAEQHILKQWKLKREIAKPQQLSGSPPPELRYSSVPHSALTRRVSYRRTGQSRWQSEQLQPFQAFAAPRRPPGSATKVGHPGPAAKRCPQACKLAPFQTLHVPFPSGIAATCGSTPGRSYWIETPSTAHRRKQIARVNSRNFSPSLAASGPR